MHDYVFQCQWYYESKQQTYLPFYNKPVFYRFSVTSFNEFISQNEENKNVWDRNEVHSPEGFFKTTTSINTAGKSRCSNAVKVAENIIAAEQKHLTNNTESAKSFNVNSFKEMNH